jgi:ABC-type molybdenum transport system ATPase subunit/photorepair protein PhrA
MGILRCAVIGRLSLSRRLEKKSCENSILEPVIFRSIPPCAGALGARMHRLRGCTGYAEAIEMSEVLLRVKNLNVARDGEEIIKNLSFEVRERETLIILGPNGAGKSTLLRTLLGLLPYQINS